MKTNPIVRGLLLAGACAALVVQSQAQFVQLNATINGEQETPPNSSPATGTAVMLYNVADNTFDLDVTLNNFANPATLSHIHEGAPGVAGAIVTDLGGEAVYTRSGNTLTASFHDVKHGGDRLKLLQGGAYYNIHSAQFPGGEIRGQLIAQPKKLVANFTVAQEQAAFPAVNLAGANLNDFGAAVMIYDPVANRVSLRIAVYNFTDILNNSHFHEGAPGVSGPVVDGLGSNANAGGYTTVNGFLAGGFEIPYTGDPIKLLTGGAYLNFHSTVFPNGECRGQVRTSEEVPSTRVSNLSTRGFVGAGEQVLIEGITVNGPDPVRVMVTAKGPSLTQFGVSGVLANPRLAIVDSGGHQIASNDDIGTIVPANELASLPGVPSNPLECALLLVLPPGNYSAVVSGNGGTGVALLEVTDLRNSGLRVTADTLEQVAQFSRERASGKPAARPAIELCGLPLAVAGR